MYDPRFFSRYADFLHYQPTLLEAGKDNACQAADVRIGLDDHECAFQAKPPPAASKVRWMQAGIHIRRIGGRSRPTTLNVAALAFLVVSFSAIWLGWAPRTGREPLNSSAVAVVPEASASPVSGDDADCVADRAHA